MEKSIQNSRGYMVSSIVGEGAVFTGDIEMSGLLRIDGDLVGMVRNDDRILVGSTGRIQGKLYSDTIIIGGVVKGEIYAQSKVVILSSGLVLGNIYANRLVMEKGALLDGKSIITENHETQNIQDISSGGFKLDWDKLDRKNSPVGAGR